ncbi:thiol-disulfide oxidoreductase DCC family protein [Shewanella sp. SR44-3]|uniref:thiol-disulfide oxidoreductase DCC family protein n=1 Tax=Shewanella sp. SR44-3 TaxID=2760936 RepID=UPI0015FC508F|nr:DUF393 domain-containing protein [Shewanella sp. SR44-3]MBB1268622.1 DUF393 domain-containing protein [Shewanella sp. SR44-3]
MELIIFYDGACPLCRREMDQLKYHDTLDKIQFEDLNAPEINARFPELNTVKANTLLHGLQANGDWLYGLDVTAKAWGLTGKHKWIKLLRLPLIKPVADIAYLTFARHRYRISYLLTGEKRGICDDCKLK